MPPLKAKMFEVYELIEDCQLLFASLGLQKTCELNTTKIKKKLQNQVFFFYFELGMHNGSIQFERNYLQYSHLLLYFSATRELEGCPQINNIRIMFEIQKK